MSDSDKRTREKDERYLVMDPVTGRLKFDAKRAWFDAVKKCTPRQAKEVNRSLKKMGISASMTRVDVNIVIQVYQEKKLDPNYGPEAWTIAGMLSGAPPTPDDMRQQSVSVRQRALEERLRERSQTTTG